MSAPYIRGYLNSQKKHRSMGGTKLSMTFATKSAAPKLPDVERGTLTRTQQRPFFVVFTKKCYPQKNPLPTGAILMIY